MPSGTEIRNWEMYLFVVWWKGSWIVRGCQNRKEREWWPFLRLKGRVF